MRSLAALMAITSCVVCVNVDAKQPVPPPPEPTVGVLAAYDALGTLIGQFISGKVFLQLDSRTIGVGLRTPAGQFTGTEWVRIDGIAYSGWDCQGDAYIGYFGSLDPLYPAMPYVGAVVRDSYNDDILFVASVTGKHTVMVSSIRWDGGTCENNPGGSASVDVWSGPAVATYNLTQKYSFPLQVK